MSDLLSTKVLLTVQDIVIALVVFLVLLIVFFILGRVWQKMRVPWISQEARWARAERDQMERENGALKARLNIITQAIMVGV